MAVSLVYALLDVEDESTLRGAAPGSVSIHAIRYRNMSIEKRRRVREALYEAIYSILEGQRIDYAGGTADQASMAIGRGLARAISGDSRPPRTADEMTHNTTLKTVLQKVMHQAIDDILFP